MEPFADGRLKSVVGMDMNTPSWECTAVRLAAGLTRSGGCRRAALHFLPVFCWGCPDDPRARHMQWLVSTA